MHSALYTLQAESFEARQSGIFIIAITLLNNRVPEFSMELNAVVSPPSSQTRIQVDLPSELTLLAKNRTIDLLCNNVDECGRMSLCANESTCIDRVAGYYCACPPGSAGATCSDTCLHPADIVVALDVSGSIGEYTQGYDNFVRSLVLRLNVDSRVGFIVFSDKASIHFRVG